MSGSLCYYDHGYHPRLYPLGAPKAIANLQLQPRDRRHESMVRTSTRDSLLRRPRRLEFSQMLGSAYAPDVLISPEALELVQMDEEASPQHRVQPADLFFYRQPPAGCVPRELLLSRANPQVEVQHSFQEHPNHVRRWKVLKEAKGQFVSWSAPIYMPLEQRVRAAQVEVSLMSTSKHSTGEISR